MAEDAFFFFLNIAFSKDFQMPLTSSQLMFEGCEQHDSCAMVISSRHSVLGVENASEAEEASAKSPGELV